MLYRVLRNLLISYKKGEAVVINKLYYGKNKKMREKRILELVPGMMHERLDGPFSCEFMLVLPRRLVLL